MNTLEKMRLDFAGAWPLRRAMPEADDTTRHEIVRGLFYLITIAAEDAAALAVEGQVKGLSLNDARASTDSLRALGARIETLSAAIAEVVTGVGNGDATV